MLPSHRSPTSPGEILAEEFLVALGMTQTELAARMGVTVQTVNLLVNGKRAVTAETALLLARVFNTTPEFWMTLQVEMDLWRARVALDSEKKTRDVLPINAKTSTLQAGGRAKDNARNAIEIASRTDQLIRKAIQHKRLMRFTVHDRVCVAEPHHYGVRNGEPQLLVYQVGGESSSGRLPVWRWVRLKRMSNIEVLERKFRGRRSVPPGHHTGWDLLFLRVAPAA